MSNPIDDVLQAIPDNHTIYITGGMNTQGFRQSTNIEDRRSQAAIARDQLTWSTLREAARPQTAPEAPAVLPQRLR